MAERFSIKNPFGNKYYQRFKKAFQDRGQNQDSAIIDVVGNFPVPSTGSLQGTALSQAISEGYKTLKDWGESLRKAFSQFKYHGNYGGPLYSAGKFYEPDQIITRDDLVNNLPTDELDRLFMKHDLRYQLAASSSNPLERSEGLKSADAIFLREVQQLLDSGGLPSSLVPVALAAQQAFSIKLATGLGYNDVPQVSQEGQRVAMDYLNEDLESLLDQREYRPSKEEDAPKPGEGFDQTNPEEGFDQTNPEEGFDQTNPEEGFDQEQIIVDQPNSGETSFGNLSYDRNTLIQIAYFLSNMKI